MMIHVFIGTKAQYVKMAPIILEMEKRHIEYNLIDSGQHSSLSKKYREFFHIRDPDYFMSNSDQDIATIYAAITWSIKILLAIIFTPKTIYQQIFKATPGVCLVHGDTPTTLLSVLAAKRVGIRVVHVESGLRSYNLFNPFPEELIRIITMKCSDCLLAPSQWAFDNLLKMKLKHKAYLVEGNTNIDALRIVEEQAKHQNGTSAMDDNHVIFSIHRVETLVSKARLEEIIELALTLSKSKKVLFCLHPPTKKSLIKYGLYNKLIDSENIIVNELLPYPDFIAAIKKAQFVVTDGGSIQEECFFLNIPCLLMRRRTERMEGMGSNVCLSEFKQEKIEHFIRHYQNYRHTEDMTTTESPSSKILDLILGGI